MTIYNLYDGEVQIEYGKHPNAGTGRKVEGYWLAPWTDGDLRIPRVTSVDTPIPFMMPAAWGQKVAKEGGSIYDTTARDLGTTGHAWIEGFLEGSVDNPPEGLEGQCMDFLKWHSDHEIEVHALEQKVYSREHHYAGTLDADLTIDGSREIVDFKFSEANEPRYSWAVQTAAYQCAREEESDVRYDARRILCLSTEGLKEVVLDDYDTDIQNFLNCLHYNQTQRKLKW